MKNKETDSPLGIGIITVFMILLVLCLSIFAILTFFSAKADLRLSQINATTISDYYRADLRGKQLAAEFSIGGEKELKQLIPINDIQSLYIHLLKQADGAITVLAWQTTDITNQTNSIKAPLPVWDGIAAE